MILQWQTEHYKGIAQMISYSQIPDFLYSFFLHSCVYVVVEYYMDIFVATFNCYLFWVLHINKIQCNYTHVTFEFNSSTYM